MKVNTRTFGEIEISENDIITFDQPILGFEENKRYVFMIDESLNGEFIWLQCLDDTDLCFVLANPKSTMLKVKGTITNKASIHLSLIPFVFMIPLQKNKKSACKRISGPDGSRTRVQKQIPSPSPITVRVQYFPRQRDV